MLEFLYHLFGCIFVCFASIYYSSAFLNWLDRRK